MFERLIGNAQEWDKLKKEQQEAIIQQEKEERERILALDKAKLSFMEKVERFVDEEKIEKDFPKEKDEVVYIDTYGITFETQGYEYFYFIIGTQDVGKELTFDYKGVSFKKKMVEGFNRVYATNGTKIKANEPFTLIIVRQNYN